MSPVPPIPPGDWLTVTEALALIAVGGRPVSRRRVQALAKDGKVKSVVVLGRLLVGKRSLAAWVKSPDRKPGRPRKNP